MYRAELIGKGLWSSDHKDFKSEGLARAFATTTIKEGCSINGCFFSPYNITKVRVFPLCSDCNDKEPYHGTLCCKCYMASGNEPSQSCREANWGECWSVLYHREKQSKEKTPLGFLERIFG